MEVEPWLDIGEDSGIRAGVWHVLSLACSVAAVSGYPGRSSIVCGS